MLEVKNITKIYHSKHAEDVVALDDISLNLGDKGLVFLLGKSGSGKSTVLNTIGGLDSFDKGEIIINGKSSKDFKQKDFDAYRNTYIGFIFQEYNVLPDFTVAQNIGLALELQGKKADKETIDNILATVDLTGYGDRKPNQLSGGQKQRIAIARALVKNPQIIMADEPTGALDSKTGRQVFETLRKLANEKLVIVVSHDRESAELFADRIIELKDGRILSDRVQKYVQPKMVSPNISLVQNNLVHIKGGKLTLLDRQFIDKMVSTTNGDIFISASNDINRDIRQSAKINETGQSSVLVDTTDNDVKRSNEPQKFNLIRGKMRTKDTFKMGASSLKSKKGKLVVSVILAILAMALFGFADTMACFNSAQNMYQTIQSSENKNFSLQKVVNTSNYFDASDHISPYDRDAKSTQADLDYLRSKYTNHRFIPVYNINVSLGYYKTESLNWYTNSSASRGYYLTADDYNKYNLAIVHGNYPATENEVAISLLEFECYKLANYRNESYEEETIQSYGDIVGKKIEGYTITGIINTNLPEDIKTAILNKNTSYMDLQTLNVAPILETGFHYGLFFGAEPKSNASYAYINYSSEKYSMGQVSSFFTYGNDILSNSTLKTPITSLNYNQAIFCFNTIKYNDSDYRIPDLEIYGSSVEDVRSQLATMFASAEIWDEYFANSLITDNNGSKSQSFDLEIVGVYATANEEETHYSSKALAGIATKKMGLSIACVGEFNSFITRATGTSQDKDLVYECCNYESLNDRFLIQNEASPFLKNFYNIIKTTAQVFLYIGIFFAVFATLLIMSFIGNSIAYKKKEIGILRALGATGHDVYRIFTWESLIIVAIIFVIASILVFGGSLAVNIILKSKVGLYLSLLSFGPRQLGLIGGICLLIGLLASWLPTRKVSKMKPIDAIQERK